MWFDVESVLKFSQWIRWKHILILTICLISLHLLLFSDSFRIGKTAIINLPGKTKEPEPEPVGLPPEAEWRPLKDDTEPYYGLPSDEYVAVCMAVKDQSRDLTEFFVHHYHHMNISRFYIMDDGSNPPLSEFDYPGVPRSALTFTYQPAERRVAEMQLVFYTWCMERYRNKHVWMAFLDGDEFLDTPGNETFHQVLETFERNETVGALGVNWQMHSSSGLLHRPDSVRKSFTTCIYDDDEHGGEGSANGHIKSIVKMPKAGPPYESNPHKFHTGPNAFTVGEHGDVVETIAWRRPITRTRVGLHHYAVKSREEYEEKMNRGNGMSDPKREAFWEDIEFKTPHVNCTGMVKYNP